MTPMVLYSLFFVGYSTNTDSKYGLHIDKSGIMFPCSAFRKYSATPPLLLVLLVVKRVKPGIWYVGSGSVKFMLYVGDALDLQGLESFRPSNISFVIFGKSFQLLKLAFMGCT